MTYREKFRQDRPEYENVELEGAFCVHEFGYTMRNPCGRMDAWKLAQKACKECWDQDMSPFATSFTGTVELTEGSFEEFMQMLDKQEQEYMDRLFDGLETMTLIWGDRTITLVPKIEKGEHQNDVS